MASIVTYDIPGKHRELKSAMFALGYKDQIADSNSKTIYFPNTTLHHLTKTAIEARNDVQAVCKKLDIKLERCVATLWEGWAAIYGEDFN